MEIDPDPDPTYSIITDGSATSLNSSKDDLKKVRNTATAPTLAISLSLLFGACSRSNLKVEPNPQTMARYATLLISGRTEEGSGQRLVLFLVEGSREADIRR
jgi:hypothetical protein